MLDTGAVVTNLHVIEDGERGYVKEIILREGVKDITCLVIFYDAENKPLDFVLIRSPELIPGALAKRTLGFVDASVKKLTTLENPYGPGLSSTKVEFRILGFEIPISERGIIHRLAAQLAPF